ncbi:MAG: HNH endonuclease [Paramuribaculum sp.]|nr:HNH endonuclease [Paramuribaculum sp.]
MSNKEFEKNQSEKLLDAFCEQKECEYKDEYYSVRDNGAVYRHTPSSSLKSRPLDNFWTFGKKNVKTGYMTIGSHRVHLIVATAFHGSNDTTKLIVDHIDTNRCNNRPDNLRWVTRLENALNNPVTRKRIEFLCGGDINRFLENPACLRDLAGTNQDVMWMRTVSAEEAKNAYERVMRWSKKPSNHTSGTKVEEWLFSSLPKVFESDATLKESIQITQSAIIPQESIYYDSTTPNVKQKFWITPTEFPLCPEIKEEQSLEAYMSKLEDGKIVTKNIYSDHRIDEFQIYKDKLFIRTHTESDSIKPYSLITVFMENGSFIHEGTTFFTEDGAVKAFTLAIGREWTGGDVFDDYC